MNAKPAWRDNFWYSLPILALLGNALFFLGLSLWCFWDHDILRSAFFALIGVVNGIAVGALAAPMGESHG